MRITEVTFRQMVKDYVYRRLEFKKEMKWMSNFCSKEILIKLEERPNTQESQGYHLVKEDK